MTLNIQKKTVRYVLIGDQDGWQLARGGSIYGRQANYPYVWGILGFVFSLAFVRTDEVLHIRNLDVLALLGFLTSHIFFRAANVHWAVLLWYPPLLYLLARTLLMGFGYGERVEKMSDLPTPIVAFELVLLYWFYAYIIWFEPFVFVALLLANNEKTALGGVRSDRQAVVGHPKKSTES